uniref:tRNA-splicing endonuclease subunit SEN34 n=1 Tax=Cyprinus carpio TaxID=7962 RepID=A0A8C1MDF2_CYPCA
MYLLLSYLVPIQKVSANSLQSGSTALKDMDTRSESEHQPSREALIDISFCGSTPLLWKVSDMKRVRSVGVVGALVGSLARPSRARRPLELLQEEALLLLLHCSLRWNTADHGGEERNSEAVRQYEGGLESSYKEQCALALEGKNTVLRRIMNEKENAFHFPGSAMAVQLCTARAGFSHYPEERSFHSTDWPMPRDERLNTRFCVYRDLRNKGFYLTSAGKFGGDFLVYPGDPLRFHAHFIALCISVDEELPLCDILAIARLGSNVKKTVLLCSPVEGDVVYSSLQWSSMV